MAEDLVIPKSIELKPLPASEVTHAARMVTYAGTIVVASNEDYEIAADELKAIKARAKEIEDIRVSFVAPLNDTVKRINAFFKAPLDNLALAESTVKSKMLTYRQAEEEKAEVAKKIAAEKAEKERLELERKAREEHDKKMAEEKRRQEEEERHRREKEESERLEREAHERELAAIRAGDEKKAQAEREERQRQETLRKENEEKERKNREASERARIEGEARERKALEEAAVISTAPPPVAATPKAAGTSVRKKWKGEVTSKRMIIEAICAGKIPESVIDVNEGNLNRLIQASDGAVNFPGVRVYAEATLASRS